MQRSPPFNTHYAPPMLFLLPFFHSSRFAMLDRKTFEAIATSSKVIANPFAIFYVLCSSSLFMLSFYAFPHAFTPPLC